MARYINVNELLNNLPDDLPYKASVKRVLIQAPTADVVPKSEVERIFKNIDGITDLFAKGIISELEMYDMIANLKKKYTESEDKE